MRLPGNLLAARQDGLDVAQRHRGGPPLVPLDDPADHLAHLSVVFVVQRVAFGLANLLDDHLLGGLGADPPDHLFGIQRHAVAVSADRAVFAVDVDHDLGLFAVVLPGRGDQRRFDRLEDDLFVDILVAVDRVDDPQHFSWIHGTRRLSERSLHSPSGWSAAIADDVRRLRPKNSRAAPSPGRTADRPTAPKSFYTIALVTCRIPPAYLSPRRVSTWDGGWVRATPAIGAAPRGRAGWHHAPPSGMTLIRGEIGPQSPRWPGPAGSR